MTDKAQHAQLRKIRFALVRGRMHLPAHLPPLLALTDPARTPNPIALAHALPKGSGLIYRHFGAPDRFDIATQLARIAARRHLCLLIGNDPRLAWKVGADGVHWSEAKINEVRHWRRCFTLMSCAAHSRRSLVTAQKAGVDAALLSAVFPSRSPSAGPPMGICRFRTLTAKADLPLYALGGVNSETMGKVANFAGIAAIDGVEALMDQKADFRI